MKRKQVYLFGCIEKNIGDDLFIYIVCKRYPNTDFIISEDAKYLEVNRIDNLKYNSLLKKWLKFANNDSENKLKRVVASFFEKIIRIKLKKLDSIYIVGNAFKNMNYKGNYQLNWLKNRISISNRFYLISTNYGPSNSINWKNDCSNIFSKMSDVCFRDFNSYELFKNLDNVRYAPDAVLSLYQYKIDFKKNNLNNKYIIISTIDCFMDERSDKLKESAKKYEDKMSFLINEFNKSDVNVIILNSNYVQDSSASKRIFDNCLYKDKVSIYSYDGNIEKILELFNNASAVLATRLHTIILSWIYDIPVIPIVYDIKVENMLKSYNFTSLKKNIDDLSDLSYEIVTDTIENYSFKMSDEILNESNNQFIKTDCVLK